MESPNTYVLIALILAGAIILLLAIFQTSKILKLLTQRFKKHWLRLLILMIFFFVGYLGVVFIVGAGHEEVLQLLTGVIFFFGAVFVYLVVVVGLGTFRRLHEVNEGLEERLIEIKAKNEELEQFNYATSHDLMEPMNTVTGFTRLLKEEYGDQLDQNALAYIQFSSNAADRMRVLINSLMKYLQVGREGSMEPSSLNRLVHEVVDEMQGTIQEVNAKIDINGLPELKVNRNETKRLFQNLLSNAIKYRKKDQPPEIRIRSIEGDNFVQICVEDNGIGIPENSKEQVFQIFKQLHNKNEYEGLGLGLAMCKKIVDMHGGSIWVESEEGKGTKMFFTLRNSTIRRPDPPLVES